MREIELKAHAGDPVSVRKNLEKLYGEGKDVHKSDHYFRRPGESIQAMRIRSYNGIIEMTCKKTSSNENGENNFEYEFQASPDQLEPAIRFFHALGLEDFFVKKKDGLEWYGDGAHIELLSVNNLGWFLEIEILLPFNAPEDDVARAGRDIHRILHSAGLSEEDIEVRSYREMILEGGNGIQG